MHLAVGNLTFSAHVAGPEDGRPVLLLHGFPQSGRCWDQVVPMLTARGLRTIAPDQRGYSPGARPSDVSAYTAAHLVADVLGVLDALSLSTVDLVGHDWGSWVAWQVAVRHPERVRSLVALSVPHPVALSAAMAGDPDQRERTAYIGRFREEGNKAEHLLLADDAARLRAVFADSGRSDAEIDVYVAPLQAPGALTAALSWYRAMTPGDLDGLGPSTVPTTYVWSDEDTALGRSAAEACREQVTGSYRFVELAGISHWIPDQAPEAVVQAIGEHVATT